MASGDVLTSSPLPGVFEFVSLSIDRAFEHHMRQLFTKMATQMEGSHSEVARASFRKQLRSALDARSEMQAIAQESLRP